MVAIRVNGQFSLYPAHFNFEMFKTVWKVQLDGT